MRKKFLSFFPFNLLYQLNTYRIDQEVVNQHVCFCLLVHCTSVLLKSSSLQYLTLIKIKRYIKELIYVFFKPFTRFSYFVMYSNLSSLSLSLSHILREVLWLLIIILIQMSYISESNDSYRYLLQSTRKIDIIVSPLKVDRISFLLQFSVPSPKSFRNTDSLIIA